jgi:hypothetical protein
MVGLYTATIYESADELKTAIDLISTSVTIQVLPFQDIGQQKFILIANGSSPS